MADNFTQEELEVAKSVDLIQVATALGYTPKRIGKYYTLKEMDSMRIYPDNHWCRFSQRYEKGHNGGSQIDFIKEFENKSIVDAVLWLLDFAGYSRKDKSFTSSQAKEKYINNKKIVAERKIEKKEFILPEVSRSNNKLYIYLSVKRCLSNKVIKYFLDRHLIYESLPYHNVVFKSNDVNGVTRHAHMRGTYDNGGKGFKGDVPGNDKNYGFNVSNNSSDRLVVFEGQINMMSYMDIYDEYNMNYISLGMTDDAPLEQFLKDHPNIKYLEFGLDNDEPGIKATMKYMEKYKNLGYEVTNISTTHKFNDYNDWLKDMRQEKISLESSKAR